VQLKTMLRTCCGGWAGLRRLRRFAGGVLGGFGIDGQQNGIRSDTVFRTPIPPHRLPPPFDELGLVAATVCFSIAGCCFRPLEIVRLFIRSALEQFV
jgi:hypothetical protein